MEALQALAGINWMGLVVVAGGMFVVTFATVSVYRHLRGFLRRLIQGILLVIGLAVVAIIAALVFNYGFDGLMNLVAGYFKSIRRQSPDLLLAALAGLVLGAGLSRRRTLWK